MVPRSVIFLVPPLFAFATTILASMVMKFMSTETASYFFSVLGNHDYRGDALAQLSPVLRQIDSRFICMRSFIVNAGTKKVINLNL